MLLNSWIDENRVTVLDHVDSWEEAVRVVFRPLLRDGAVTEEYVEQVVACIAAEGPFVVIAPHIALPHVRYEEGVRETSSAFLKLNRPVNFGVSAEEPLPVELIVGLATRGNNEHLRLLREIVRVFECQETIEALLRAKGIEGIAAVAQGLVLGK